MLQYALLFVKANFFSFPFWITNRLNSLFSPSSPPKSYPMAWVAVFKWTGSTRIDINDYIIGYKGGMKVAGKEMEKEMAMT